MAVWLVGDGVPRCVPIPRTNLASFGRWRHVTGRENYRGEPRSTLSGRCRLDSARVEGSSIVDEPGAKGSNREVSDGKADL